MVLGLVASVLASGGLSPEPSQRLIRFPGPISALHLSSRGTYLAATSDAPNTGTWLASVTSTQVVKKAMSLAVSQDELYAAGLNDQMQIEIFDLAHGKSTVLPYTSATVFAPAGHKLAFFPSPVRHELTSAYGGYGPYGGGSTILIYEPETKRTTTLNKFGGDLSYGSYKAQWVRLSRWSEHGIEVSAHMAPPTAADPIFFVDPIADRATRSGPGYNGDYGKLMDGGNAGLTSTPNGFGIVSFGPSGPDRVLFEDPRSSNAPMDLTFKVAGRANRMVVWTAPIKTGPQSLWLVNTANARAKRLLEAPFDGRNSLAYAISSDGERLAYENPKDANVAVVMDVPRL